MQEVMYMEIQNKEFDKYIELAKQSKNKLNDTS